MKVRLAGILIAGLLLSGCGQGGEDPQRGSEAGSDRTPSHEASVSPTQGAPASPQSEAPSPSSACDLAFARAAAVDEFRDTVSDLYGAAKACDNLKDWELGAGANPGAIAEEVDPVVFAYNMCTDAPPDVQGSNVCREAVAADPLGIQRFSD